MHATRRGGDIATIQILMTTDQAHRLLGLPQGPPRRRELSGVCRRRVVDAQHRLHAQQPPLPQVVLHRLRRQRYRTPRMPGSTRRKQLLMKTNVTYQDDADPEDCEFAIFGDDVTAVPLVGELVVIHDPDRSDEGPGVPYIVDERHWSVTPATRHQHGRADEPAYQHVTVVLVPRPEPVPVAERTSKVLATVYAGEGATLADRVDQLIATAFVGYHLSGDTVEINERLRDDVRALLTLHAITLRDVDRVAIVRWLRDRGVAEGGSMMDLDAIADAIERGHHLRLRGDR